MCSHGHFLKCPHSRSTQHKPGQSVITPPLFVVVRIYLKWGEQARGDASKALWRFPSKWKGNLVVLARCKWANLQRGQMSAFRSRRRTAVLLGSERTLARLLCSVAVVNRDKIPSHGTIRIICFKASACCLFSTITTVFRAQCCICGLRISVPVC